MSKASRQKKEIEKILKGLGVTASITITKALHFKVVVVGYPTPVYTSGTPSDHRTLKNFKSRVKRVIAGGEI